MTRWKCTVAYDGSGYCGWQSQRNGNSVQEQIESALYHICGKKINILASGRTDAGVNAWGQVFHFDSDTEMKERKWQGAINAFLPGDIHIRKVERKDERFHARYCVSWKQYDYRINFGEYNVMERNHVYQCPYKADIERMRQASLYLIGTHDFTSFNSNSLSETPDQVRTVYDIRMSMAHDVLTISYSGNGFLRYMVRMMSAELLAAGGGKIEPEEVKRVLEAKDKRAAHRNAHPEGLTLQEVHYFDILAQDETVFVRSLTRDDPSALIKINEDHAVCSVCGRHDKQLYGFYVPQESAMYFLPEGKERVQHACELLEKGEQRKICVKYAENLIDLAGSFH